MSEFDSSKVDAWSYVEKEMFKRFPHHVDLFMSELRVSAPRPHLLIDKFRGNTFLFWSMACGDFIPSANIGNPLLSSALGEMWNWLYAFIIKKP